MKMCRISELVGDKLGDINAEIDSPEKLLVALESIGVGIVAILNSNLDETTTAEEKRTIIRGSVVATIADVLGAEWVI